MKQLSVLAMGVLAMVSCDDDDKSAAPILSNKTIPLSDTSAYNATHFAKSWEMFMANSNLDVEYSMSFERTYKDGNLSQLKSSAGDYGKFSLKATTEFTYDSRGVIQLIRYNSTALQTDMDVVMNKDGYIRYVFSKTIDGYHELRYNAQHQLAGFISRTRSTGKVDRELYYTYDANGRVKTRTIKRPSESDNVETYTYNSQGLVTKDEFASNNVKQGETVYGYDSKQRRISRIYSPINSEVFTSKFAYKYTDHSMTIEKRYNGEDRLGNQEVRALDGIKTSSTEYRYAPISSSTLDYLTKTEYTTKGHPSKITVSNGTIANAVMQVYMTLEVKENTKTKFVLEGRVYDKGHKLLYIRTRTVDSKIKSNKVTTTDPAGKTASVSDHALSKYIDVIKMPYASDYGSSL